MTEAEWLTCREPGAMLNVLRGRHRKLRLFACACARECAQPRHLQPGDSFTYGLELSERLAEGEATPGACKGVADELDNELSWYNCSSFQLAVIESLAAHPAHAAGGACGHAATGLERRFVAPDLPWHLRDSRKDPKPEIPEEVKRAAHRTIDEALARGNAAARALLAGLLREIVGNPFRPVAFDTSWRTDTALSLARQMYDSRDFGAMPILADALQDAGCNSDDILDHCRGPGPHVRGCWVVDLVLGKS